jgi:hypothetical protein
MPSVGEAMRPIDFAAYAGDCTITGKMTMFGDRLTDFLNGQDRFRVHHLECQSLDDGHTVELDSLSVERNDLLAVVASGPRGSEKQRLALRANRLQVSIGPYLILGQVHAPRGVDALASVLKREPMIPLTHATIAYETAGTFIVRDIPTLIVNRLLVDWISPTTEAATLFPEASVRSPFVAGLTKRIDGSSDLVG